MIYNDHRLSIKSIQDSGWFSGYASVFHHIDHQADSVVPGAFSACVKRWHATNIFPKMLWQHDPSQPIGRWEVIEERPEGLYVEGRLFLDLAKAREIYLLLKERVIDALSIGYKILRADQKEAHRVLEEVDVLEISLVTFPANSRARVTHVKSDQAMGVVLKRIEDIRERLRSAIGRPGILGV